MAAAKKPRKSAPAERPVLVTTEYRGVFFGYAADTTGRTIKLSRGRNCIYWPAEAKGFVGLATVGPVHGSRVGPAADITLHGVTAVVDCTAAAVALWETFPWK